MIVLSILGLVVLTIIAYVISIKSNQFTYKKYKFEFFEKRSATLITGSYVALIIAFWIFDISTKDSVILNGQILVVLALIVLLTIVNKNIKRTNFFIGIIGSILQLIIYSLFTVYILFIVFALLGSRNYYYDDRY